MVHIFCSYPEIHDTKNGQRTYLSTKPTWTRNEAILYPDGTRYNTQTVNSTSEELSINTAMMTLDDIDNLKLGCYLVLAGGLGRRSTKESSIMPPGEMFLYEGYAHSNWWSA